MIITQEHPEVRIWSGTAKEMQAWLETPHADQMLLIAVDHIQPDAFKTLAESVSSVVSSMYEVLLVPHEQGSLQRLAEALVPRLPASPRLLKEAAMLAQARRTILDSGDWLTAAQVAQMAGFSTRNPSAQTNKWKKQGLVFAIRHNGVDYFPGYGLDRDAGFRPIKAIAEIIEIFGNRKDGWGMAYWFSSPNSFLGGQRPQDVLGTQPERVIEASRDEIQEIAHG